jgi:hypothetical protein
MSRTSLSKLVATALAVAATAPAAALAADEIGLKTHPKLTQASKTTATLTFRTDAALPRANGAVDGKVRFENRMYNIGTSSATEHRYFARLKRSSWTKGGTYRVRIFIADQKSIPARVILK